MFARYRDDNNDMLFPLHRSIEDKEHCVKLLLAGTRSATNF
ncbi:hypothetical protein ACS15_0395 [Ralstonia insidiosa]|uniref:Uncharacterized protein n=1 Tax=Ralstonia insidiosa TaxID=190721 RepID=A0AAC9BHJ5_9RALS|nr:hypothetical protein ACS15_0395 [Ralstonia insidiosa]